LAAEPRIDPAERSATGVPASLHDLLFDRYADAVLVADAEGRYVEANLAATTLLGYSRAELLEKRVPDVLVMSELGEAEYARFTAEGYWRGEVDLRCKDGSMLRVEARATVVETPEGSFGVAIVRESGEPLVTALATSEAQFQAIVRSSDDAIFSEDADGRILTWNRAAERMFGYAAAEIVGEHVSVLSPPERRTEMEDNFARVRAGERVPHYETTRLAKDGSRVEVSLSVAPILDSTGTLVGIVAVARDVTNRREADRRAHVLYELSHRLGRATSPSDVFDAAMDALQRALHTDRASVLLLDADAIMRFRAWRGLSAGYRAAVEGHNPWSLDDAEPALIHVPDVTADASLDAVRDVILGEGIRSLSFIPLSRAGELLGKFMLYFDVPRTLSEIDQQMASSIANQTAFALMRIRAEDALERAHAQLELITLGSADGITIQDEHGGLVYANDAGARLSGFDSVEAFLSGAATYARRWEILAADGETFVPARLPGRRALDGEQRPHATLHVRDRDTGREYWREVRSRAITSSDGTRFAINLFHDVTEERRRDAAQRLLVEAGTVLATSLDEEVGLDRVLDLACEWNADVAALFLVEGGGVRMVGIRHVDPGSQKIGDELLARFASFSDPENPAIASIANREPIVLNEITDELLERAAGGGPAFDLVRALGLLSAIVVPIRSRGSVVGSFALGITSPVHRYDESDVATLEALAERIGTTFDNLRLYRERDFIARTLQASLLPVAIPDVAGLEIAKEYRPAGEGFDVGGDFYDVFEMLDGSWAIVVGDVCGKGTTAAALTGVARHTIRAGARLGKSPAEVLALVNDAIMLEAPDERFCTVALAEVTHRDGGGVSVRAASGGHPPPLVLRADGTVEEIDEPGTLLGLFEDPHLPESTFDLAPGDTLIVYTDGVTDEQFEGEEFGEGRLAELVRRCRGCSPAEIASRIVTAVEAFNPEPPRDDIAVVAVRATA
jgi:PAS domain S-box-containing protein